VTANATASAAAGDRDLAARRMCVATVLAGQLADRLAELERFVEVDAQIDRALLRGKVDDVARLANATYDELVEMETP
jgi:hypothetical protein